MTDFRAFAVTLETFPAIVARNEAWSLREGGQDQGLSVYSLDDQSQQTRPSNARVQIRKHPTIN